MCICNPIIVFDNIDVHWPKDLQLHILWCSFDFSLEITVIISRIWLSSEDWIKSAIDKCCLLCESPFGAVKILGKGCRIRGNLMKVRRMREYSSISDAAASLLKGSESDDSEEEEENEPRWRITVRERVEIEKYSSSSSSIAVPPFECFAGDFVPVAALEQRLEVRMTIYDTTSHHEKVLSSLEVKYLSKKIKPIYTIILLFF